MKTRLVKPENTIKKKAGTGGFREEDLAKAQGLIEHNDVDFRPVASDLLEELGRVLARIEAGDIQPGKYFDEIMYPMMQLKAQGGLFGYMLITTISLTVIDFLESIDGVDARALEIVAAYRKTIQAILALELKKADSPAGNELRQALADACARYARIAEKKAGA